MYVYMYVYLYVYLTKIIIPRAWMSSESTAREAEGRMGYWHYWVKGHEGERNNCFSKTQLVGQKNIETKHLSLVKARLKSFFVAKTLKIWWANFATRGLQHIAE